MKRIIFGNSFATLLFFAAAGLRAADEIATNAADEVWSVHGQATVVEQAHPGFHAGYSGPNSMDAKADQHDTITSTLFFGRKLWDGGAIYFDPEMAQGFGLSHTYGIAGFPNGEASRAGKDASEFYVARVFLRQTINFGGESENVEADQNQLAGRQSVERLTITAGKMSAVDIFDNNTYSHDGRKQFMNWALMDNGAWDFSSDARQYTWGLVAEWNEKNWTLRWAHFLATPVPNGKEFDWNPARAFAEVLEWERRYDLNGHPGAVRLLGFANRAHLGDYREALDDPQYGGDIANTRDGFRFKYGGGVNAEQEIAKDFGVFSRVGWNDGRTESWMFTEIDETASFGASLKGSRWNRPDDVAGIAGVINGISTDHRDYLASGGTGFIIGDGRLNYAPEEIAETYYSIALPENFALTLDYQLINNPAYNSDRGPANFFAARLHAEF